MAKTKLTQENVNILANILRHIARMDETELIPIECYCKGYEAGRASVTKPEGEKTA